jgi:hypothetical protein
MSREPDDSWNPEPWEPSPFEGFLRADWDEDDWEEYLAQQDLLHAKYDELFETLRDHPRRDDLIAAELHAALPEARGPDPGGPGCDECRGAEDGPPPCERAAEELDAIPAYRLAHEYALALERDLAARFPDLDEDEDAGRILHAASEAADRVAGGHCIGYDRDTLCGNIACCRRALGSLAECFDGLLALRKRGVLPPPHVDRLLVTGQRVGEAVAQRIDELRSKVWWR